MKSILDKDGESKVAGDKVASGTVNQFGAFDRKAEKVGEDSFIQQMIRLVQTADAGKAKIVGIALTAAVCIWFVTGEILRSVMILVVFCPCALVLATPTAIMAADIILVDDEVKELPHLFALSKRMMRTIKSS